ncbi:hypothetical protein BT93_L0518 [Corymbia citriodora subsp. variegata]|uniref:RING-type domain-containing protein n=1 Tax=Corymbia citriodora subsp. variegata TaxID=360336 RepID=A0A8T0CZM1_CORYI|nr:hypothetical protein BT93_L0518 [Corymbia citriodora subsp. variegata]
MNDAFSHVDPGQNMGDFAYGTRITFGVLAFIILFTLVCYLCTPVRVLPPGRLPLPAAVAEDGGHSTAIMPGLDEAALGSFPKLLYSRAKATSSICCSICLSEYRETDVLRLLPGCGHYFHSKCVDPWLRMNPSCPNCRTLPVLTPVRAPLAEVAPLAASRQ